MAIRNNRCCFASVKATVQGHGDGTCLQNTVIGTNIFKRISMKKSDSVAFFDASIE
jgi:hypothetical protein